MLIDEAYIEFGGDDVPAGACRAIPNVLVGRTFSKAYGLAGMRVGVVIGQPQALDPVRAVTLPFNINGVALAATLAALEDTEFLPRYAAQVARIARAALRGLRRLGLEVLAERGQLRAGAASAMTAPFVAGAGRARSVHVRDRSKDPTTPGCIRITAGVLEHTDARDRGARIGRSPRGPDEPVPRRRTMQATRVRSADHRDADHGRAGRSTARAATTSAPASGSSTTCSSCSRGTAAST